MVAMSHSASLSTGQPKEGVAESLTAAGFARARIVTCRSSLARSRESHDGVQMTKPGAHSEGGGNVECGLSACGLRSRDRRALDPRDQSQRPLPLPKLTVKADEVGRLP